MIEKVKKCIEKKMRKKFMDFIILWFDEILKPMIEGKLNIFSIII